jgi:outer membrane protein TolC
MNPRARCIGQVPFALCSLLLVSGCTSPLAPESPRTKRLTPETLRTIHPLTLPEAPKPDPAVPPPDPAETAKSRFAGRSEIPLTIEEARAQTLANNLDLKVALVDPTIASERVNEEEARFEAAFTTRALWQDTDAPTASALNSAQQEFQLLEPGVRIPLRTGGTATVTLPLSRNETNNAFSTLNPSYESDLQFSISHPLLRNAGRDIATAPVRIAVYNQQASEARTKLEVITQLAAADRAYWRLYQARRDLEVAQQQYDLAQNQLERARRLVNSGRTRDIEQLRAESGLADRLDAIIRAQNAVLFQQRELKRVMNAPGLEVSTTSIIIPKTDPAPVEYLVDPPALVAHAIDNRMDLLETELRLLADAANIRVARNQMLPALDLDATYRINGLGDSGQHSLHTLERNHFEDWSLGATLDVPLGNESAKSRLRQAILTRLQRLSSLDARRDIVRQDVLNAVDSIQAGWESILATRQATILATRTLQAEQRQFDLGSATSTDVLDAATRLAEAQLAEIRAVTDYQLAQVDLAAATGTLPGAAHIQWTPAATPSLPPDGSQAPDERSESEALIKRLDTINNQSR